MPKSQTLRYKSCHLILHLIPLLLGDTAAQSVYVAPTPQGGQLNYRSIPDTERYLSLHRNVYTGSEIRSAFYSTGAATLVRVRLV
jgi:hypothetical protein